MSKSKSSSYFVKPSKKFKQSLYYKALNKYCLRVPLLALSQYFILAHGRKVNKATLKRTWNSHLIREAIYIASPYLFQTLNKHFRGSSLDNDKQKKLELSFIKYLIRSSVRCTPYGIFSGISIGNFADFDNIELEPVEKFNKRASLSSNIESQISKAMEKNPTTRKQLKWFVNSSLYKVANQYRYLQYTTTKGERVFSVEGVEHSKYLENIFEQATEGKTIVELTTILADGEIAYQEAEDFVYELIANQLLVSELELGVNADFGVFKISNNKNIQENPYRGSIRELKGFTNLLDKWPANPVHLYMNIKDVLKGMDVQEVKGSPVKIDMYVKTKQNCLKKEYINKIMNVLDILNKITPYKENSTLVKFKQAFMDRYGDKEIPLPLVMDVETGIGYGNNAVMSDTTSFLNDINVGAKKDKVKTVRFSKADEIIYRKLQDTVKNNEYCIELCEKDFIDIEPEWGDLPDTMSALVEIYGDFADSPLFVNYISGPSATNLLARFGEGDSEVLSLLTEIANVEREIHQDKILAEIVHYPNDEVGNILTRPQLYDFEIPYLGKSNVPKSKQINVNDILVSVKGDGRIFLKDKNQDKEIIPRLSSAHNYSRDSLPLYHFLCDLQIQGKRPGIGFSWNKMAFEQSFLPRVYCKGVILSKAQWVVQTKTISHLMRTIENTNILLKTTTDWRKENNIPQYAQLKEGDNLLLINFENITIIRMLLSTVKNKRKFVLEEFLFGDSGAVVKRGQEFFTNEVIVPLVKRTDK